MRKRTEYETHLARRIAKPLVAITLGGVLLLQPAAGLLPFFGTAPYVAAAAAASMKMTVIHQEMITAGAERIDYVWESTRSGKPVKANVHVIRVDLTHPYVRLDAISGSGGTVGKLSSVMNMAKAAGAVGGINADFFVTGTEGSPMGAQVTQGQLVSSPMKLNGMYMFGITKDRKPVIDMYTFEGSITAADGSSFPLAGINNSTYRTEPDNGYSHANTIYMYTSAWVGNERPKNAAYATPTEVLVRGGIVEQISEGKAIGGAPPADGYILRSHGKAAQFIRDHVRIGEQLQADYRLISRTSGQPVDPASFDMMVGGHTILVDQGKPASFSRSISGISGATDRSRSAVGYSKDGRHVFLVTVEEYGSSQGMTLAELQQALVQLGVWKGVNLDGGGSTTMVERPLGETGLRLAHPTEYGDTQRSVANGIGVFTTAPQGQLRGIAVSGPSVAFIGQQVSFSLKGYDTYFNPIDPGNVTPSWSIDKPIGSLKNGVFTPTKPGQAVITAKSGAASGKHTVEVIGQDQIAEMKIGTSGGTLAAGAKISVPVTVKLRDGRQYTVPPESIDWQFIGFTANRQQDNLVIGKVSAGAKNGYAIARYDGFSALLTLSAGGASADFENFEKVAYPITFQSTSGVTGTVKVVSGLPGRESSKALQLTYDFTNGKGTRAAYAVLNGSGVTIAGAPTALSADVYGDGSLNWLRAEFIDANGKAHLVDLKKTIDWTGWQEVRADLTGYGMAHPVKLKRIYVVSLEEGRDERAESGQIAIDNIKVQLPSSIQDPGRPVIKMTLGSKTATVDGKPVSIGAAPFAEKGVTYLPLRFVADAMGGTVNWNQKEKRVTVLRGDKLLEMVVGSKEFLLNGVRKAGAVEPMVRSGYTLVPIRLVSEQLGLEVKWDQKTKQITVQ
ncbi:copper amine oxidase [Paenibacillus sp. 32O-W]|uniref:stalk domain-containing protein n=1 Tax=Paenibacillus sp. 32O-W TaxID=1695218 RepID=UPI00071F4922|nr:stalk domain-containing protein [Paenibacillus sp. 32O-W]ALS26076.1 copper amine oxidase [Paenibacillus sp. 32O-W]